MSAQSASADSGARAKALSLDAALAPERRIRASGSRYQIGYQHGFAERREIHRFLADRAARIDALTGRPQTAARLAPLIEQYAKVIAASLPEMAEELGGFAAGAEIAIEDAYLLQLRRELVGYQKVRAQGDCTTFGRLAHGTAVLGQTIDLNGNMAPELTVLELEHDGTGRRLSLVSFTGLLGYLGMNDRGVAIGISLVLGGEWRPGVPGYMAIRHLLDHASNVAQCIELLRQLPLSSSRALVICDGARLVTIEYILNEMVVLEGSELIHTNHFLHPDFVGRDELNPFARTSSLRRFEACRLALERLPVDAEAQSYFDMLQKPPINVQPDGDVRRECTVASVVMRPDLGAMFVKQAASDHSLTSSSRGIPQPV